MPAAAPAPAAEDRLALYLACGVAGVAFLLYVTTGAPGLYWMDSGELTSAAHQLGAPHPTGFALSTLLGKLVSLIPVGSIAWRVTLLSATCGALTVFAVFVLARRLARACGLDPLAALAGASGGAALLAGGHLFWRQATVVEVYTPAAALVAGSLLLLLHTLEHRDPRSALALALVAGLATFGGHATYRLLVLPPLLIAWIVATRRGRAFARVAPFVFGVGALVALYLVAVADRGRLPDWGSATDLGALWDHLTAARIRAASFADQMFSTDPYVVGPHLGRAADVILGPFIGLALPLAAVGLVRGLLARGPARVLALALGLIALGDFVYAFWINPMGTPDLQNGLNLAVALGVLAAVGITEIGAWIGQRRRLPALAVASALAAMTVFPTLIDAGEDKLTGADYGAAAWTDAALDQAAPRALVLTESDDLSAGLLYAQRVEGARPDVLALVRQHLWVAPYLRHTTRAAASDHFPPRALTEYLGQSRAVRQRRRQSLLAAGISHSLARRQVLWEAGDGVDRPAIGRALLPGVPLFVVHAGSASPQKPEPLLLVAELMRIFRGTGPGRTGRTIARHLNALGAAFLPAGRSVAPLTEPERLFRLALRAWPASVVARINLGVVYGRAAERKLAQQGPGHRDGALALLRLAVKFTEEALGLAPNRITGRINAANFRRRLGELGGKPTDAATRREFERARAHLRRVIHLRPDHPEPHFQLGIMAAQQGALGRAADHLQRAINLDPNHRRARTYLGRVRALLRQKTSLRKP